MPPPRFSECSVCYQLKRQMQDSKISIQQKLGAVSTYRQHLYDQFCDRSACWALQELSRDRTAGVITILLDGMDQSKFQVPRDKHFRQSAILSLGHCP